MDPIVVNALNIVGRVTVRDPNLGNTYALYNADFSSATSLALQFGNQSQGQIFGTVKSMFVDNGTNPSAVDVQVQGSDQFFTIPAYSIGYYTIDANSGSTIILTTVGGATDLCTITFYNWERAPVVWYSFGAFNTDRPIKAQGTMEEGDTVASEAFKDPVYIGGIDRATGLFRGVSVDAQGRLDFASTVTIGAVTISDGGDVAQGSTTDAAITNPATNGTVVSYLRGMLTQWAALFTRLTSPPGATVTTPASAITNVLILASNASRKGATIYNNSTQVLRLLLDAGDAAVTWSVEVQPQGSVSLGNGDYTGEINGAWIAANGTAQVTEFV